MEELILLLLFFRMKYMAPYERSDLNDNFIINGSYLRIYDY